MLIYATSCYCRRLHLSHTIYRSFAGTYKGTHCRLYVVKPEKNDLIICSIKYFFTLKLIKLNLYIMNVAAQINSHALTHTEINHINLVYNCVMYAFSKQFIQIMPYIVEQNEISLIYSNEVGKSFIIYAECIIFISCLTFYTAFFNNSILKFNLSLSK